LAEQRIRAAQKSETSNVDLSRMELTELPESIGELKQMLSLNLSSNELTIEPLINK
jgi:Leucine-rich repeat (LRR) protein